MGVGRARLLCAVRRLATLTVPKPGNLPDRQCCPVHRHLMHSVGSKRGRAHSCLVRLTAPALQVRRARAGLDGQRQLDRDARAVRGGRRAAEPVPAGPGPGGRGHRGRRPGERRAGWQDGQRFQAGHQRCANCCNGSEPQAEQQPRQASRALREARLPTGPGVISCARASEPSARPM